MSKSSKKSASAKSSKPVTDGSPAIGIPSQDRSKVTAILSAVLSDQHVLYQKTRNYHWNLTGHRFHTLHELFEKQYRELVEAIDETAERIRMIGGTAPGSMGEFLQHATLKEVKGALIHGEPALESLAADHESCVRMLRKAITEADEKTEDAGTVDFLTQLIRAHEKNAWMLRSHLL
ncbi:MAG TPA: DNA starvation/stationary phase protection protein [Verrucomicrobiales bacterium]|nr:DNA starvation/stationary phase protection protein [Verrucomicrobiales bacterium]